MDDHKEQDSLESNSDDGVHKDNGKDKKSFQKDINFLNNWLVSCFSC